MKFFKLDQEFPEFFQEILVLDYLVYWVNLVDVYVKLIYYGTFVILNTVIVFSTYNKNIFFS